MKTTQQDRKILLPQTQDFDIATANELRAIKDGMEAITRGDYITHEEIKNEMDSRLRTKNKKTTS